MLKEIQLQWNKEIQSKTALQFHVCISKKFLKPCRHPFSHLIFTELYIFPCVIFKPNCAKWQNFVFLNMLTKSCLSAWGSSSWSGWKNIEEVFLYVIVYRWCKKACVQFSPVFLHNFTLSDLFCMCCRNFQKNKNKELLGVTEAILI